MKGIQGLLILGVAALVGWFVLGQTGGAKGGDTGDLSGAVGTATGQGKAWWTDLTTQPWFYTAAGAVVLGGLGMMLWKRIGGFGRGFALVLLGGGLALFLFKVAS